MRVCFFPNYYIILPSSKLDNGFLIPPLWVEVMEKHKSGHANTCLFKMTCKRDLVLETMFDVFPHGHLCFLHMCITENTKLKPKVKTNKYSVKDFYMLKL